MGYIHAVQVSQTYLNRRDLMQNCSVFDWTPYATNIAADAHAVIT